MLISIIIPAYNEADTIIPLLDKVVAVDWPTGWETEILIVNDGSQDSTPTLIQGFIERHESLSIHHIDHQRNRGKGAAVRSGILKATGDRLIIQDADLEYEPQEMVSVLIALKEGETEVVYGSRVLKERNLERSKRSGKHPNALPMAYVGGRIITGFTNLLTRQRLTDAPTCYKAFTKHALEGIRINENGFGWEPEITMKFSKKGFDIVEVPISYHPRMHQEGKKIGALDGIRALWVLFKYRLIK